MEKLISIKTKKYSKLFSEFFNKYKDNFSLNIDGNIYNENNLNYILENICTNKFLKSTRNLILKRDNLEILGFHDNPNETWIILSELNFIKLLSDKGIVRFKILDKIENNNKKTIFNFINKFINIFRIK
jgi:hypothetical protein